MLMQRQAHPQDHKRLKLLRGVGKDFMNPLYANKDNPRVCVITHYIPLQPTVEECPRLLFINFTGSFTKNRILPRGRTCESRYIDCSMWVPVISTDKVFCGRTKGMDFNSTFTKKPISVMI